LERPQVAALVALRADLLRVADLERPQVAALVALLAELLAASAVLRVVREKTRP